MEKITLPLNFGKDQESLVRRVLDKMILEDRDVSYLVSPSREPDMLKFNITFADPYDIYLFGHHQAETANNDTLKHFMQRMDTNGDKP